MSYVALLPDRVLEKIEFTPTCWLWIGGKAKGYGYIWWDGKVRQAYRVLYEQLVGPVPEGLELDHLCRVPACVNPDHLEPVTHAENMARSPLGGVWGKSKTHCPAGHSYAEHGFFDRWAKGRRCRVCTREQRRARRAKASGE